MYPGCFFKCFFSGRKRENLGETDADTGSAYDQASLDTNRGHRICEAAPLPTAPLVDL